MLLGKINIPPHVRFLFSVYLWGLLFFTVLRVILLVTNLSFGTLPSTDYSNIFVSFFYGFRFDTCVSCYLLSLPFMLSSIGFIFTPLRRILFAVSFYLIIIFYCAAFFICCADIPYFNHFSSRITTSSLLWADSLWFMIKMILGTFSFWIYLIPFFILCILFFKKINLVKVKVTGEFYKKIKPVSLNSIFFFFILAPVIFLGIRGRVAKKSPIVNGTAYFCDNNFLNQLGLNAVFTFMTSALEDMRPENKRLNLMDEKMAIDNVKGYLHSGEGVVSPVARKITTSGDSHKMNVVLVIMEGMSMYNVGIYTGKFPLTPVLDSLKTVSLSFKNIYTQGIHTFNGIYSSLYSYPSLLKKHPLENIPSKKYYSMAAVLKEKEYQTLFFVTHDGQFDNTQGFLTANGFDKVFSESDYPSEKILGTMGVPDDYLFEYSIPKMNEAAAQKKNFFCGFMTGSNHYPIVFPPWVKKEFPAGEEYMRIVQYSDWAIGEFLRNASKQSWYNNTIFVFVADHGTNQVNTYEMPLSFHHSPLIIFAPGLNLKPASYDCLGGQLDIFPTVMGLMNLSYTNSTMGIDLLKESRPYIYFTADDKIGCLDKDYYFVHSMNGNESLYRYENLEMKNYMENYKAKADSMRNYAYSMLQATQWMVENEKFSEK